MARGRTRVAAKLNRPVALVTGAANGIGRAISHHLLDAGWCVLAVDLPKMRLIQHFRGWARSSATMEGDVSDEDVVREAVRFALDRFGRLDAVVANAGIMIRRPPPADADEAARHRHQSDGDIPAGRAAQRRCARRGSIVPLHPPALMSDPAPSPIPPPGRPAHATTRCRHPASARRYGSTASAPAGCGDQRLWQTQAQDRPAPRGRVRTPGRGGNRGLCSTGKNPAS